MTKMKKWKSWPFWVRGIIIAEALYILFSTIVFIIASKGPTSDSISIIPLAVGMVTVAVINTIFSINLGGIGALLFCFIIPGFLGAVIGKLVWEIKEGKRGWKHWPYLIKGAVLSNLVFIISFIVTTLIVSIFSLPPYIAPSIGWWPAIPGFWILSLFKMMGLNIGVNNALLIFSSCFIMYGLIGALLGLLVCWDKKKRGVRQ